MAAGSGIAINVAWPWHLNGGVSAGSAWPSGGGIIGVAVAGADLLL